MKEELYCIRAFAVLCLGLSVMRVGEWPVFGLLWFVLTSFSVYARWELRRPQAGSGTLSMAHQAPAEGALSEAA